LRLPLRVIWGIQTAQAQVGAWNMERIEDGSIGIQAQRKARWRTPELTQDKLVEATNIDSVVTGDDHVISSGVPLGETS
jgi:hypothetical protein